MSGPLTQAAYERLIDEDIAWLMKQPRTLERKHIVHCMEWMKANRNKQLPAAPSEPVSAPTPDEIFRAVEFIRANLQQEPTDE